MKATPSLLACVVFATCLATDAPKADVPAARTVEQIQNQFCNVCHATGWNGAPISGDTNDWQPRIAGGFDAILRNAKQGFNTMPPMGTCADCTDAELKAVIEAMIEGP